MKKAIVLWLLLLVPLFLSAQEVEYKVFKIKGEVCKTQKKGKSVQKEILNEKDIIKDKEIISLTQGSELRLVDIRDSVMFVLHDQCAGSVKSLINTQSASRLSMTKKYFDFVVKSLTGNGFNEGIAAARTTAVYRDDADMLLMNVDNEDVNNISMYDTLLHFPVLNMSCLPYAAPAQSLIKKETIKKRQTPQYFIIKQ